MTEEVYERPLELVAKRITMAIERANAVAMSAARLTSEAQFAKPMDKCKVAELAELATADIVCVFELIHDIQALLKEAEHDHALNVHIVTETAERKIADAQQSDCHPKYNPAIRKQVWDLTGGKCAYCDTELAPEGNGSLSFVVEHVVPTSQGGPDNLANYVPACMSCNTSKGADHVLLFIQRRFPNRARPQTYTPDRTE